MAVLQTIRNFFTVPDPPVTGEPVAPAAETTYTIQPLTREHLDEVLRLNMRCFSNGENYTKHTFSYLLTEPGTLSYQAVAADGTMVGFVFVMVNQEAAGHLTTIGVAPEHRRRGLGERLLKHLEDALRARNVTTVVLEVRVSNLSAQHMYKMSGYTVVQRMHGYYNNGEDGYLMMKALF